MLHRLGFPRIHIATKLYGAVALTLAVVYGLAAVTTRFASDTEQAAVWVHEEALQRVTLINELEAALEQQRQLVASLPAAGQEARAADARAYADVSRKVATLMEQMAVRPTHAIAQLSAALEQQGALAYEFALGRREEQAAVAAGQYAQTAGELQRSFVAERHQRARMAEEALAQVAARSRSLITWVCAAAAVCGLLIGPIGLLLLRKVLRRMEGVGWALMRLARNDTSVDIPGLDDQDEVGQLARSVAVFKARSIELLQKKLELERLNLQLDAAINNMPLGLSMFDAQERLMVCNKKYADMYDLPSELSRPGTAHCALWDFRKRQGAQHYVAGSDRRSPNPDHPDSLTIEFGNDRIISVSRQPLKGGGWVALHEDITQRRRQEQEITHLARHDPLTSLGNRALFRERLNQALKQLSRGHGFAVMCLDLDRFKIVNDTLGHPVGDVLLRQVSERLLACVRQGDVVARFGGDEFAIIQADVRDPDQTESLAARIVETISKVYDIDGQRIDISTSIGMTLAPRDGSDADQLMKNADLALYRTKANGRNGYSFFKAEMNDRIQVRRTLENDLRKAFEKEQLALHYQPTVCLKTRRVEGFEVLMRWTHPQRGSIPPAEFIALAEEIGLIGVMGEWALRKACLEAAHWSQPARVAINLSPLQIKRDLIEVVLQALAESGLSPERLELEVTEALLQRDTDNTFATLHQLRQLGVRVTMDNFGRGQCSLSYLRKFPFDTIKIDRLFIAGLDRDDDGARAIVETIVGFGRNLGMTTVAEGIENFEQLQTVRAFGCAQAQGYYFSPAVPSTDVERVLRDTFEHARAAA